MIKRHHHVERSVSPSNYGDNSNPKASPCTFHGPNSTNGNAAGGSVKLRNESLASRCVSVEVPLAGKRFHHDRN